MNNDINVELVSKKAPISHTSHLSISCATDILDIVISAMYTTNII